MNFKINPTDKVQTEIKISPYGNLLVYKKGYTVDFVRSTIRRKRLNGLRIFAVLKEERLSDLNFLSEYSFLEALSITTGDDHDLSFLSGLKGLKELTIVVEGEKEIDLSNQVNLKKLAIQWRKGRVTGLEKCQKLTYLCLIEFKEDDLLPISQLTSLTELIVKTASIMTLNGLQNFSSVENLVLGNCRRLRSIKGITGLKKLTSLEIDLCSKIDDYSFLGNLSNLKKLKLADCKGINSIGFVNHLLSLEKLSLSGSSDVLDGDMMPAKNVKKVFYKHRQHYNIKIENKEHEALIKSNLEKIKRLFSKI